VLTEFQPNLPPYQNQQRVGEIFPEQENSLVITCNYETLYDYFARQVKRESKLIKDLEDLYRQKSILGFPLNAPTNASTETMKTDKKG
jgi:hypothetical protein